MGLFKPAWMSNNWVRAVRAIENETDQAVLNEMARTLTATYLRLKVARRLKDQTLAQQIYADAAKGGSENLARDGIYHLTDQTALIDVAKNAYYEMIRVDAASKIANQELAQELLIGLTESSYDNVRWLAKAELDQMMKTSQPALSDSQETGYLHRRNAGGGDKTEVVILPSFPPFGILARSSALTQTGDGLADFNDAIQANNNQQYVKSIGCFESAIDAGLDVLRTGYAYALMGKIKLLEFGDVKAAAADFIKALSYESILYETAHTAAQFLHIFYQSAGDATEASRFEALLSSTVSQLNYSLDPAVAQKVQTMARGITWHIGDEPTAAKTTSPAPGRGMALQTSSPSEAIDHLFDVALPHLKPSHPDVIQYRYTEHVSAWGSKQLYHTAQSDPETMRRHILQNLENTSRQPGFRHFYINMYDDLNGSHRLVSMVFGNGDGASVCIMRTEDEYYYIGNYFFE